MRTVRRYSKTASGTAIAAVRLGLVGCLLLFAARSSEAQSGFRVIVHPSNPVASMTQEAISRLFLKKDTTWKSGDEVVPVDQTSESAIRGAFSESVHGRGTSQIQSYWQQQLFSGSAVPPSELAGDAAVIDFVKRNRGAIGYISSARNADGVRFLQISAAAATSAASTFPSITPDMTPPRLLDTVDPDYPLVARRARYECALTVKAEINTGGTVENVVIVTPCARFKKQLNEAAIKAIRRWTFEPALDSSGQATSVSYTFQVWFTL